MRKVTKVTKNKVIVILFFLALFISLASALFFFQFEKSVLYRETVSASLTVSDRAGFDVSPIFAFGEVVMGGSATRTVKISNPNLFPIVVKFIPMGDIKNFVDKSFKEVKTNSTEDISVSALVPSEAIFGNYTGSIMIEVRKVI